VSLPLRRLIYPLLPGGKLPDAFHRNWTKLVRIKRWNGYD
jgi:hypothetical protein